MADRRPESNGEPRVKRMKTEDSDPRMNPYLAHMYQDPAEDSGYSNGYSNGYNSGAAKRSGLGTASPLAKFPRHASTAAMAKEAENGPNNPFTGQPLSQEYFKILKTRRDLPVHAQR